METNHLGRGNKDAQSQRKISVVLALIYQSQCCQESTGCKEVSLETVDGERFLYFHDHYHFQWSCEGSTQSRLVEEETRCKNIGCCGTVRTNRNGFLKTVENDLPKKACFMHAWPNMNYCKIVLYLHMSFWAVLKLAFLQQLKLNPSA